MSIRLIFCLACLLPLTSAAFTPQVYAINRLALAQSILVIRNQESGLLFLLRKRAESALARESTNITMNTSIPPSGDKRDYFSLAPYYWSIKGKSSSRWIARDGRRNPLADSAQFDAAGFSQMADDCRTLSLAYYFFGKKRYAEKVSRNIRSWFLSPTEGMRPSFDFAQMIPGDPHRRPGGIIEARHIVDVIDSIQLIRNSGAWSKVDDKKMKEWITIFQRWLITDSMAVRERKKEGNHGTWFDVLLTSVSLYIGDFSEAHRVLSEVSQLRINRQIRVDGSQPIEARRAISFNYYVFNLRAIVLLANMAENVFPKLDIWGAKRKGVRMRAAIVYLSKYADPGVPWAALQIKKIDRRILAPVIYAGCYNYGDVGICDAQARLAPADPEAQLLYPPHRMNAR